MLTPIADKTVLRLNIMLLPAVDQRWTGPAALSGTRGYRSVPGSRAAESNFASHDSAAAMRFDFARASAGAKMRKMKIATFNVNGVDGRLAVLLRWLKEAKPGIVCLQELTAPQ